MILKGSQRGGARQLANHLMNVKENDHVALADSRGFVSEDLFGAMAEVHAVAKGTRCRQEVFSLSLSPPKDADVATEILVAAVDRAEAALGLTGQPRAIVIHEKNGRKHAHAVWSRIDEKTMTAVNLPHFKLKLNSLSKELYLEHGWGLPDGHKTNGWKSPLNFSLAEWQQAKRLDLDPREIKQIFQSAWQRSDNLPSFGNALEEHGYYIAKGDRRGLVAVDLKGEVYSLSRWTGVKTKELEAKLGNGERLPGVEAVKTDTQKRLGKKLGKELDREKEKHQSELKPLTDSAQRMAQLHRLERVKLQKKQDERLTLENKAHAARFKRGLGAVLDLLTGRLFKVRRANEQEAFDGYLRDRAQREQLGSMQLKERAALQKTIDSVKSRHRQDRMETSRQIANVLEIARDGDFSRSHERGGLELNM